MLNSSAIRKALKITALLVLLILSLTVFLPFLQNPSNYSGIIDKLDEKQTTAVSLMAGSSAVSVALTLIPDDVGTPIAQQLAELSKYFLIVIAILLLEKYLLVIFGFVFSAIIVPLFSALYITYEFMSDRFLLKKWAIGFLSVGIIMLSIVPASYGLTSLIDNVYEESISDTLRQANEIQEIIESAEQSGDTENLWDRIKGSVSGLVSKATGMLSWAKWTLSRYVESLAVMLVTVCLIPILTACVFISLLRRFLKLDFSKYLPPRHREIE